MLGKTTARVNDPAGESVVTGLGIIAPALRPWHRSIRRVGYMDSGSGGGWEGGGGVTGIKMSRSRMRCRIRSPG